MAKKETFETSLKVLEESVAHLEQGDLPLEDALAFFEKGIKAVAVCQKLLSEAELKIEKLRIDDIGQPIREPFVEETFGE